MQGDRGLAPVGVMERLQGRDVEIGEDVAVDDEECLVKPELRGGETNRARGIQRFRLDRVVDAHAGDHVARVGLGELFGQVTQREHRVGDAVATEPLEDAFDHRHAHERQHLFRRFVSEGTKTRPFAADQDDRLQAQPFVVVVVLGFVVVVLAVVVVVVPGFVVVVTGVVAVVVDVTEVL